VYDLQPIIYIIFSIKKTGKKLKNNFNISENNFDFKNDLKSGRNLPNKKSRLNFSTGFQTIKLKDSNNALWQ